MTRGSPSSTQFSRAREARAARVRSFAAVPSAALGLRAGRTRRGRRAGRTPTAARIDVAGCREVVGELQLLLERDVRESRGGARTSTPAARDRSRALRVRGSRASGRRSRRRASAPGTRAETRARRRRPCRTAAGSPSASSSAPRWKGSHHTSPRAPSSTRKWPGIPTPCTSTPSRRPIATMSTDSEIGIPRRRSMHRVEERILGIVVVVEVAGEPSLLEQVRAQRVERRRRATRRRSRRAARATRRRRARGARARRCRARRRRAAPRRRGG